MSELWNCHGRLVHRTCRTSRFSWLACLGTSKNNRAINFLLKYSGKIIHQIILFFLIFCAFFRPRFALINLLMQFFVARALQSFIIIIKYMSIVPTETQFACLRMLGTMCMVRICIRLAKEQHIWNSNKNQQNFLSKWLADFCALTLRPHTIDHKASSIYFNCVPTPLPLINRQYYKKSRP
jgi:hypothetical protein